VCGKTQLPINNTIFIAGVPVSPTAAAATSAPGNITTTCTTVLQPNTTETNVSTSSLNNTQNQTSIAPVSSKQPVLNESAETLAGLQGNVTVGEGDVILPEDRNAVKMLWSGGIVHYEISPDIGSRQSEVKEAFKMISSSTCIRFEQHTSELNYIDVKDGQGCASFVGCRGGSQPVYFGITCSVGNLAHELLHAIGLHHEHTRQDREGYVNINWQNIIPDKKDNFKVKDGDSLNLPYDFGSIMHYGPAYFSIDGSKTLEPKESGVEIGQRTRLSPLDIKKLNKLYKCGGSKG
ncbi:low choriolytic enzyme, partial [Odontesthes bonariensis]|uniref:low choriolytic enzyme n=1 Tax=Odontesthes bonariensis TaxID=219752 RepID=UPI003F589D80